jgi:transposase
MDHVAIDLGSSESQICRRDSSGAVLEKKRLRTAQIGKYLSKLPPSRVIVETCSEAFGVADVAKEFGHEVRVVPATLVRSLGVGARGVKTDERDAALLSEVSSRIELPSVHIPSHASRELKSLSTSRERLIAARTMLINSTRGWLRTQAIVIRGHYGPTFSKRMRAAVDGPDGVPAYIERLLESIETLNEQIHAADAELVTIAKGEMYQRLMSAPGVGPVTAVRFAAAVDDVKRFPRAHALQSYLGLTPGERSSGAKVRRTGITKAGPAELRRTLVQAAWAAMRSKRHRNDPMIAWATRLKERRGHFIAVVALARKLAGILYAILRDGSRYDASRGANKNIG